MGDALTQEQRDFLRECEEELKDRYTEKDEEYVCVLNAAPPAPPVVEPWHAQNPNSWRNNRRHQRRDSPYQRGDSNYQRRDTPYMRGDSHYQRRDSPYHRGDTDNQRRDSRRERRPY